MPDPIKMILRHALYGGGISIAFVAALLWGNVGNLWHLVTRTAEGPLALGVLIVLCWITFGSVQIAIRLMMMGSDDTDGGGHPAPEPLAVPVRQRAAREG